MRLTPNFFPNRARATAAVVVLLAVMGSLRADDTPSTSKSSPSLDDLAWLEGSWSGTAFGGDCDEYWSPAAGGNMMGMFRLTHGDKANLTEFMTLEENDGELMYYFRHVSRGHKLWKSELENALSFVVTKADDKQVVFEAVPGQESVQKITFERETPDKYEAVVEVVHDGKSETFRVPMQRVPGR